MLVLIIKDKTINCIQVVYDSITEKNYRIPGPRTIFLAIF